MEMKIKFPFHVRVPVDHDEIWNWVDESVPYNEWGKLIGFMTSDPSSTYCFLKAEQAMMFRLRWL